MAFAGQKEPASTGGEMGCWGKEWTVVNSCLLLLEGQVLVSFQLYLCVGFGIPAESNPFQFIASDSNRRIVQLQITSWVASSHSG